MDLVKDKNINPSPISSTGQALTFPSRGEGTEQVDLSIIIVAYKSKEHLAVLLPSILGSKGMKFVVSPFMGSSTTADESANYTTEIIIVDNDSRDGTSEFVKTYFSSIKHGRDLLTRLINNQNTGFASGNNIGIKESSGRYVLLLNPDTKIQPDTLKTMLDFMEQHPEVGISGCKLIKGDGKLDLACRRRFPNPWNSFKRLFLFNRKDYNYINLSEDLCMEVDSVVGAFLLIRKSVINIIGLLDEDFFMYGEDLDWCWRCKASGYKVLYYPGTFIYHYKGQSSKKEPFIMLKAFHDSMWIFYKKHYYKNHGMIFNYIVWLGIYGRMLGLVCLNLLKSKPSVSK